MSVFLNLLLIYVRLFIWGILSHLYIMTTAWPIIEDVEPIDLGLEIDIGSLGLWHNFSLRSKQYLLHIHIHTLTF